MSRHRQHKSLKDRYTPAELQRRQEKHNTGNISRAQLAGAINLLAQQTRSVLGRGFFGRFKWLLFGR